MAFKYTKAQMDRLKTILRQTEEDHAFLSELLDTKRDDYEGKSDKWKEGDNGTDAETWIEEMSTICDSIESLKDAVSEVDGLND